MKNQDEASKIAVLENMLSNIVETYDRENFMTTADFHSTDCRCLRCLIDAAGGYLREDSQ